MGCSPGGHKEPDTTEQAHAHIRYATHSKYDFKQILKSSSYVFILEWQKISKQKPLTISNAGKHAEQLELGMENYMATLENSLISYKIKQRLLCIPSIPLLFTQEIWNFMFNIKTCNPHPSVSSEDWFQDPPQIPKSTHAQVSYVKGWRIYI